MTASNGLTGITVLIECCLETDDAARNTRLSALLTKKHNNCFTKKMLHSNTTPGRSLRPMHKQSDTLLVHPATNMGHGYRHER
jgi:hypothetical protein